MAYAQQISALAFQLPFEGELGAFRFQGKQGGGATGAFLLDPAGIGQHLFAFQTAAERFFLDLVPHDGFVDPLQLGQGKG